MFFEIMIKKVCPFFGLVEYFLFLLPEQSQTVGKSGNLAIDLNQEFNTDENKAVIFCMYSGTLCINKVSTGSLKKCPSQM